MSREVVSEALDFLVKNVGQRPKDLPRDAVKQEVAKVEQAAQEGLSTDTIHTLARKVIFVSGYEVMVRRRLLYCLLPAGQDFPLQVVPLAVSSATVKNVSPSWQQAVLSWLEGMLVYGIIDARDPLVHLCYTSIFNLSSIMYLCPLVCRVLYHLTVREDVTTNRIQVLVRLKQKPAFDVPVSYILRLYRLFRPDMVAGKLGSRNLQTRFAPAFQARLLAARLRLQEGVGDPASRRAGEDSIWRDGVKVERVNVYQRPTPVPVPQVNIYTKTVEEQKKKAVYVTQYHRFADLMHGLENWEEWLWPTNPASHLMHPIVIPLFRPHHVEVQVSLTNWLEVALRTEVIEGLGSPSKERQESLLRAALELCLTNATSLPVINNFLVELMIKWNQKDHFVKILELLQYVSFTSLEIMCETLIQLVSQLLVAAPLVAWCRVVSALTSTACHWAVTAHRQTAFPTPDKYKWPQQVEEDRPVLGLWLLTDRLERFFLAGVLNHHSHPLVLHHILDYYEKVDQYCEVMELPLAFFPPPLMTFVVMTSTDLSATHRHAQAMTKMKHRMETLKRLKQDGCNEELLDECLFRGNAINESIFLFVSGVLKGKALTSRWREKLEPFYPFGYLENVLRKREAQRFTAITHKLAYLPFICQTLTETTRTWKATEFDEEVNKVLVGLRDVGLTGIEEVWNAYRKM